METDFSSNCMLFMFRAAERGVTLDEVGGAPMGFKVYSALEKRKRFSVRVSDPGRGFKHVLPTLGQDTLMQVQNTLHMAPAHTLQLS